MMIFLSTVRCKLSAAWRRWCVFTFSVKDSADPCVSVSICLSIKFAPFVFANNVWLLYEHRLGKGCPKVCPVLLLVLSKFFSVFVLRTGGDVLSTCSI